MNMKTRALLMLYLSLLCCAALATQPPDTAQHTTIPPQIIAHQSIQLPPSGLFTEPAWTITSSHQTFTLYPRESHHLLHHLPAATRQQLDQQRARYYRGSVAGDPQSWLRLAWVDGQWSGGWYHRGTLYMVDDVAAAGNLLSTPSNGKTILFKLDDLILPWLSTGDPIHPQLNTDRFFHHLRQRQSGATNLQQLLVTIVSDTQFSAIHGSNTNANVIARLNFVDGIYTAQLSVSLGLLHHEILTNNGTLTATESSALLNQFSAFMRTGTGSSIPRNGVAHLFTGRNIDGQIVGRAYLGVLCSNNFGFGFDQDFNGNTISALIFAHELGHNFNAPHDGEEACINETARGIMNPFINGSRQFSDCSIQQMGPEIASANCLVDVPLLILEDGFEAP